MLAEHPLVCDNPKHIGPMRKGAAVNVEWLREENEHSGVVEVGPFVASLSCSSEVSLKTTDSSQPQMVIFGRATACVDCA